MGKSRTRGWKRCGCYVWRTRKPHAIAGLPFVGRHTAYVGQTNSRYFRDRQHVPGKSWADLDPKVYPLPCLFPHVKWCREWQEKIYIRMLFPVYNTEWNKGNPRRIKPDKAQRQRRERDKSRLRFNILPVLTRGSLVLIVFIGLVYAGWEKVT